MLENVEFKVLAPIAALQCHKCSEYFFLHTDIRGIIFLFFYQDIFIKLSKSDKFR